MSKVKQLEELRAIVVGLKDESKRIVLTNGCFDILHVGHIRYLRKAKMLGDILIVAVNSDESVRVLKGSGHPIQPEQDRMEILSALEFVDFVLIFHEKAPDRLIRELCPDIHVKGGDYELEEIPESKLVESLGGKTVIVEAIEGRSTTDIFRRIRALAE